MSNIPTVAVNFSNGNLTKEIAVIDGQAGFIGAALAPANYGKVFTIYSLSDAEDQGLTEAAEPEAHRHITEFYQELAGSDGGKQESFWMLVDPATTMAQMLDATSESMANKLILAGAGKIAYLGVFKTAAAAGNDFLDTEVSGAMTASKALAQAWNAKGYFFRVILGGVVNNEASNTIFAPNTADNGFAGVFLPSTLISKRASIGLELGRKVKYACHIKQGKASNGPINASTLYIGTKLIETMNNLDSLAGKGYMIAVTKPGKSGYYFGIDYMASTDDYKLLVYGAVIDAAARVAFSYYQDWLESECDVDESGKLLPEDAKHLEENMLAQITTNLGDRISGVEVYVDPNQVIVPGNALNVQVRVIPKGYYTFINVDLGLTA